MVLVHNLYFHDNLTCNYIKFWLLQMFIVTGIADNSMDIPQGTKVNRLNDLIISLLGIKSKEILLVYSYSRGLYMLILAAALYTVGRYEQNQDTYQGINI